MFATNHLGPFLLTHLLLERLKTSAPARIIHVTAPSTVKVNFDDLQSEQDFRAGSAFGATKMCNLLVNAYLAAQLAGTGVTSNALHPGLVRTNLLQEMPAIMRWGIRLVSASPERAAEAVLYLASAPEVGTISGKFFKGQKQIAAAPYAADEQVQRRLWEVSQQLVGIARSG